MLPYLAPGHIIAIQITRLLRTLIPSSDDVSIYKRVDMVNN